MEPEITGFEQLFGFLEILLIAIIAGGLLVALLFFGIKAYLWFLRFKNRSRSLKDKAFFKIQIPEGSEIEPAAAENMYSSMYGIKKSGFLNSLKEQDAISFEIVADHESIEFYAVCPKHLENLVEKQINGSSFIP